MRPFRYRRQAIVTTLFAGAAAALIGCQQLITPTPAAAPITETTPAFRALETQKSTFISAAFVPAAITSGSFEAPYVKPTAVPTPAPAADVAPAETEPEQQI